MFGSASSGHTKSIAPSPFPTLHSYRLSFSLFAHRQGIRLLVDVVSEAAQLSCQLWDGLLYYVPVPLLKFCFFDIVEKYMNGLREKKKKKLKSPLFKCIIREGCRTELSWSKSSQLFQIKNQVEDCWKTVRFDSLVFSTFCGFVVPSDIKVNICF